MFFNVYCYEQPIANCCFAAPFAVLKGVAEVFCFAGGGGQGASLALEGYTHTRNGVCQIISGQSPALLLARRPARGQHRLQDARAAWV